MISGDEVVPGNNGPKDQVMALKWVNENIKGMYLDSRPQSIKSFLNILHITAIFLTAGKTQMICGYRTSTNIYFHSVSFPREPSLQRKFISF